MNPALSRALRLTIAPGEEWPAIRRDAAGPGSTFVRVALPLAFLPAVSWSLGLALFGGRAGGGRENVPFSLEQALRGGMAVFACGVVSVLALSASIYCLAALFDCKRDWARASLVAIHSATPVFLGGAILAVPDLAFALLLAALHAFFLLYGGLRTVLGVKEDRAAEYVALTTVLFSIASTAMGALGAALGIL